jgi:hypothetical protein
MTITQNLTNRNLTNRNPKLKEGAALYRQGHVANGYLIGNSRSQVAIYSSDGPALYSALKAGASRSEICANLSISHESLEELMAELDAHELLQTEDSAIQISQRFISQIAERAQKFGDRSKDAAFSQMSKRVGAELTLTRWLPGVADSGVCKVSARQSAHIEISGDSRAAQHLFAQLIASGVTDTQFAPNYRRGAELIGDLDVTGGYLSATDSGQVFVKSSTAIAKGLSLFPAINESAEEIPINFAGDVIKVHFGELDPAMLALWMAAGQQHILVSEINGARLTISQLVKPGLTPCTRCLELTINGQRNYEVIEPPKFRDEIPVVGAHYLSAILAAQLLSIIDTNTAVIARDAIAIDLTDLCNTEHITITRHPMCGCSW